MASGSGSEDYMGKPSFGLSRNEFWYSRLYPRGYASVAEAVPATDAEEEMSVVDEIELLLEEMMREEHTEEVTLPCERQQTEEGGVSLSNHQTLRRRQVKIETEAWEQAANEYRELLMDMCEQKLAPNLPYMKSLFLGWFEPLRNAILKEQELWRSGKNRAAYARYFDHLPADMMAVITMHKLMGLLMTGGDDGCTRVVAAACTIGEAIEQEVGICFFFYL